MDAFARTTNGWPDFMRVSPILHWTYDAIWDYIKMNNVPYCNLYDEGYTSLGGKNNTFPNEALKVINPDGTEVYLPAYELSDGSLERHGRNKAL